MQKKKFIITLLFAVLSIFMITACSDSSNESNSGGNNGGGGTVQPEPEPDNLTVKKFYNFNLSSYDDYLSNYALLSDGSLYAWGNNNYGQLGLGDNASIYYPSSNNQKINIPDKINEVIGLKDIKYDASERTDFCKYSLYAITENGELYAWGDNSDGQLGIGNTDNQTKPVKVTGITGKIKQIITFKHYGVAFFDYFSVYAITEDGSLYAWGNNRGGQLGVGDEVDKNTPTKVNLPGKIKELRFNYYYESFYAILEDGSLYEWGYNFSGQLEVGSENEYVNTPTKVNLPGTIKELITGAYSFYAILEDGTLYAWGFNFSGQLGIGSENEYEYEYVNTPNKVYLPGTIKELITYGNSVYAILEDNSLYAWGYNENGQLGVGKYDEIIYTPEQVTGIDGVIKYINLVYKSSNSDAVVHFLTEDGLLYGTGLNYSSSPKKIEFKEK